jgi:hypothetical protein
MYPRLDNASLYYGVNGAGNNNIKKQNCGIAVEFITTAV